MEFEDRWKKVISYMEERFGEGVDMQSILFLIGIQELGQGFQQLNKDQKLDVMHIAICSLLSKYGYYEFIGDDEDGWPHYQRVEKLPPLQPREQEKLMKQSIVEYFSF